GRNKYGAKPNVPLTTDEEKADPLFENEPRYWMVESAGSARIEASIGDFAAVAMRDVSRPWTDQRSARAALVCRQPATHKLPILALPVSSAFEFIGVFNSTTFD